MATVAVSSYGTLLKIGDGGGSEVFTTIGEVRDISGPGFALGTEEVSAHDGSGWREFIPTLKEGGEVTFKINFNKATTQGFTGGLYIDFVNKTKRNFQLVLPTTVAATAAFAAHVVGYPFDLPVEGAITADITLNITGAVTWS